MQRDGDSCKAAGNVSPQMWIDAEELAEKLGVANTTVSGWERAASSIDIDTLYKVCGIFGITLGEMFGPELCGYTFTEEELEVVQGFRAHPKMRSAVRVLVGMDTVK